MFIIRNCPITNSLKSKEINVTVELIQDAMPGLTASESEFIKTVITDEVWKDLGYD